MGSALAADQELPRLESAQPVAPVWESTLTVFPQINETFSRRPISPANPKIQLREGLRNSLRVNGDVRRGRPIRPGAKFPGVGATGWTPPDVNLAVGPNHIVQVVNTSIAFFNKNTGQKTFQQDLGRFGFFSSVSPTDFVFDPKCVYDQINNRFIVIILEQDQRTLQSKILLAVSDDNDPNGTWYRYRLEGRITVEDNPLWIDYPGLGYNKDAIIVTGNMFPFNEGNVVSGFFVIPKQPLLTGQAVTPTPFFDATTFTVQVGNTMDRNLDRIFMMAAQDSSNIRIFAAQNLTGTPEIRFTNVQVPPYSLAGDSAQSRGGARLDTLATRILNAKVRDNKIWGAHGVMISSSDRRAKLRWYEVDLRNWPTSGSPLLTQSGDVTPPAGQYYYMPAIAVNRNQDVSMIFTRSSREISADLMIVSRRRTDALGTMSNLTQLASSPGVYPASFNRWGDYFGCVVDPSDDLRFWGSGQVINAGFQWGTQIFSWNVGGAGDGGTPINPIDAQTLPDQGLFVSGELASLFENDGNTWQVNSQLFGRVGQTSAVELTFRDNRLLGNISSLALSTLATTNANVGATGMVWFYNWRTQRYEHTRSFRISTSATNPVSSSARGNLRDFVANDGTVKAVLRGLVPIRRGASRQFTFVVEQARLTFN